MKMANIFAGISLVLWLSLSWLGISLIQGVVAQRVANYPNSAQIIYYIGFPGLLSATTGLAIYFFNRVRRSRRGLAIFSVVSLMPILPFLFGYTGGV